LALDLAKVRVIVYDLDGTVYDDTRHFAIYAREIQSFLPADEQEAFWADYTQVVEGRHPALHIGTFYDVRHDLVLETRDGLVRRALHWDGSEIPPVLRQQLYPGTVQPDNQEIINVGDLWWVPSAVSLHYSGESENHGIAFLRVREIMSDPEFHMRPIPALAETIAALKGRFYQVLATNSPEPDSRAILSKVGLIGLFDAMYFRSNKPAGLQAIFAGLAERNGVGMDGVLSVGDNLVNEIAPARAMGCQTVFIDPHAMSETGDADLIVTSMAELIPLLRQA
jgi:FMN phosphatase YigB (HAD superfamily)